jgi:hypothetical protein
MAGLSSASAGVVQNGSSASCWDRKARFPPAIVAGTFEDMSFSSRLSELPTSARSLLLLSIGQCVALFLLVLSDAARGSCPLDTALGSPVLAIEYYRL